MWNIPQSIVAHCSLRKSNIENIVFCANGMRIKLNKRNMDIDPIIPYSGNN